MRGQDIQDKLNGVVEDLQTKGNGQTIIIGLRGQDNAITEFQLSSDSSGVVSAAQLNAINAFLDTNSVGSYADAYEDAQTTYKPVLDAFKAAQTPHEALMSAATLARKNLSDALEADPDYQTAKTNLETARADADFVAAVANYKLANVSENYGNISDAKGKYTA